MYCFSERAGTEMREVYHAGGSRRKRDTSPPDEDLLREESEASGSVYVQKDSLGIVEDVEGLGILCQG